MCIGYTTSAWLPTRSPGGRSSLLSLGGMAHPVKTRNIIILGLAIVVVLIGLYPFLLNRALRAGSGPKHNFGLSEETRFLTEEVALDKARETLRLDGWNIAEWQAHRDGRTKAPDGRVDQFMRRNSINSNSGTFMFTSSAHKQVRLVLVKLTGTQLVCQASIGR
jgi:hypothetical protein